MSSDKDNNEYILNLSFGKKKYMPPDNVKELMQYVVPFSEVSILEKVKYIDGLSIDYNERNDFTLFDDYIRELCFFYVREEELQAFVMAVPKGKKPCLYFSDIEDHEVMVAVFFRVRDELLKQGYKEVDICFRKKNLYDFAKKLLLNRT